MPRGWRLPGYERIWRGEAGSSRRENAVNHERRLDSVHDRDSFIAFVEALAAERERAEEMERADPVRFQLGGALNWQNGDISGYLEAAIELFKLKPEDPPSLQLFAKFLYFG